MSMNIHTEHYMSNFKQIGVHAITARNLRNTEFIQLLVDVLAILQRNISLAGKLQPEREALQTAIHLMEQIFRQKRGSDYSKTMQLQHMRRSNAILGIVGIVKAHQVHYEPPIKAAANLLHNSLKVYGSRPYKLGQHELSATVTSLVNRIASDTSLVAAANTLSLTDWLQELQAANKAFNEAFMQRIEEGNTKIKDINLLRQRKVANVAYMRLRQKLESWYTVSDGEEAIAETVSHLNALIHQYKLLLAQRHDK